MTPSLSGAIHRDSNTRASGPYAFQVPYVSIRIHSARYVFLASTKPRGDPDTPPERLGPVARGRMGVGWRWSGSSPWYPLRRLAAVVVTGGVVFGAALVGATSDPHGLAAASPIGGSQLAQLEPLYGAVWTPDASLDWSPDGRWIALGGGFVGGVMVVDAWTGNRVAAAQIPGIVDTVRRLPEGPAMS